MVPGVTRISRTLHAGIYREAFTLVEEAGPRNLQPFTRGSARGIKKTSVEIDISVRSCRPIYRSVKAEQGESRLSPRLSPPFFPFGKVRKEMSSTLSIFHKRIPFFLPLGIIGQAFSFFRNGLQRIGFLKKKTILTVRGFPWVNTQFPQKRKSFNLLFIKRIELPFNSLGYRDEINSGYFPQGS